MKVLGDFTSSVERALSEIDPHWRDLDGLVVCGSHTPFNPEMVIQDIQQAREAGKPFYGECYGYQLAAIEWARNVMGIKDATSEEWGTGTFVVKKRDELKVGLHDGESWWSYYEVVPEVVESFNKRPKSMVVAPYHPSYQSTKGRPHLLLLNFLNLFSV